MQYLEHHKTSIIISYCMSSLILVIIPYFRCAVPLWPEHSFNKMCEDFNDADKANRGRCQELCVADSKCKGIMYEPSGQDCYLCNTENMQAGSGGGFSFHKRPGISKIH